MKIQMAKILTQIILSHTYRSELFDRYTHTTDSMNANAFCRRKQRRRTQWVSSPICKFKVIITLKPWPFIIKQEMKLPTCTVLASNSNCAAESKKKTETVSDDLQVYSLNHSSVYWLDKETDGIPLNQWYLGIACSSRSYAATMLIGQFVGAGDNEAVTHRIT